MNAELKILMILVIFLFFFVFPAVAETQTIQFNIGWNMFSLPLNTTLTADSIRSQCGSTNKVWNYNAVSQLYEEAIQILPGKGYWLKVGSACTVSVTGSNIQSIPGLKAGWNQIGSFSQIVTFSDVKGNCNVLSGPWKYNAVSGQYNLATSLEPGYGYWIKVGSDCNIGSGEEFPPIPLSACSDGTAIGICSATKPKYCDSGNLVNRCNICGCPTGYQCQADNSCGSIQACSDGTVYGQCSSTSPKYCSSGTLINSCSQCGCPSGQTCNTTANACYITPPSTCDSTCKSQGYTSGTCEAGSSTSSTRLMGANSAGRWTEISVGLIDLLKNSGGNTYFFDTFLNYWRDNPSNYRTKVAQIRQWCKDRNITFIVSEAGTQWEPSEGWNQMRGNIIFNVNGAQDYYLNISEQMVKTLQPDMWHILDEPIWEGTQWNQTTFFNGYREFCIKTMQRLKAIKPDLKFIATSIPFWDMHPIAANPIPGMDYYLYAYYYMQNSYPPSWEPGLQAYWNATTSSALANAKQIQWNRWLDNAGLQECINKGLRIIDFGGSYSLNTINRNPTPNCMQYMEDYYQFCDKYNFDFIVLTLMPDTQSGLSENGEYFYGLGMLDGTGWTAGATYPAKLNNLGQLWAKNMLAATGSVTATCQSGESSIGQDGCSSNNLCCCKSDLVANYKFDEGSGTIAKDSSPNKNDATLYNNPTWVTGKSSSALQFNGANYVEASDSNSLDITNGITLETWVYPTSLSGWTNIIEKDQTGGYKLGFYNNQVVFTLYGLWDSFSTGTIPLGQWSHVAATYDMQNVKVYINGVLNTAIPHTDSIGVGTSPVDIGRRRTSGSYFNGVIDEIKVWNRALTADEIKSEYGVTPSTCSDGTAYGQCSSTKPKYCSSGTLINKCSQCGCPTGNCQSDGSCTDTCSDGTAYGFCSSTKPLYCSSGTLINSCSQCGCPSGYSCNTTTNSCFITPVSTCDSTCKTQNFNSGTCRAGTSTNTNLAVIPDNWGVYDNAPSSWTAIAHVDYSVTHNGHVSIRLDSHTSADTDVTREIDGTWYNVKPGDHIIARVWIKTDPSSLGDTDYRHGGRLGMDFYATTSVGYGIVAGLPGGSLDGQIQEVSGANCTLNWGNGDWTLKSWDITIPSQFFTKVQKGNAIVDITPVQINSMVLWLDGRPVNDMGRIWFADAELYINPTGTSGTCQSSESSIGQDGCSSNNLCCCSGAVQQCSSLSYPSDKWQRVWYTHSTGACLGNGPNQSSQSFDDNWASGTVAYNIADDIEFHSSRTINFATAGTYTFTLGSDDGARLWIDDVLKIDKWVDRSYTTDSVNVQLTTGNHRVRIDWYENGGAARVSFSYTAPAATCDSTCKSQGYTSGSCEASSMSGNNLGRIPNDWGEYKTYGRVVYDGDPQIIFVDTNVERTAGNPSIRSEAHTSADADTWREIDGTWYSVKPGDHIVAKVWIKTNPSGTGETNQLYGGRIGADYYAHTSAGYGIVAKTANADSDAGLPGWYGDAPGAITGTYVVPWNRDWTMVEWDVHIPTDFYSFVDKGGTHVACTPIQIDSFVLWLDVRPIPDTGFVWFADGELYINPNSSTSGTCQSSESSIGQDGCSSNNLCCCSGTATQKCSDGTAYGQCSSTKPKYCSSGTLINSCSQCGCDSGYSCNTTSNACYIPVTTQCTPANDIIKNTLYPTGSCQASSSFGWSHAACGSTSVCNQGSCKIVDDDITSYTLPSGKYARSDSISIPYTIKNVGATQWCFLTESGVTKSDSTNAWPNKLNSVSPASSASDSLSYAISCSDPLGTWSGSFYSYTDSVNNGGWNVWGNPTYSIQVVECLNDADCTNCKGSGYTCDLTTNTCKSGGTQIVFSDGFENGWNPWKGYQVTFGPHDGPAGTSGTTWAIESSVVHSGSYAAEFTLPSQTGAWANVYETLNNYYPTLYMSSWSRFDAQIPVGSYLMIGPCPCGYNDHDLVVGYIVNSGGVLKWVMEYYTNAKGNVWYISDLGPPINRNVWYDIQVMVTTGNGNGEVAMWVKQDGGQYIQIGDVKGLINDGDKGPSGQNGTHNLQVGPFMPETWRMSTQQPFSVTSWHDDTIASTTFINP